MPEQAFKVAGISGETQNWAENAVLEGTYVQLKERVGMNKSDIYVIKQADGKLKNVWDTAVLASAFADIEIGDEVRITFNGMKESPTTMSDKTGELAMYRDFTVEYRTPVSA